ncbi:MAG TPA: hypothetical protein VNJ51_09720 [Candidatus Dormibacteraeota bacterium]|nr:hypothetical protein [Candidatus Dormibacteraeota bacterium]
MDRVRFIPLKGEHPDARCWNCSTVVSGKPDARYLYRLEDHAVTESWYHCGCGAYVNVRREGVLHVERAAQSS